MSLVLRHDWLTAVADADARGRRCADPADQTRIVDACALWAEHARELAILDRAQPFASSHSRRVWCESATRSPDVAAYDNTTCEVIVMAGLPASGKDSWLAAHRPGIPARPARRDLREPRDPLINEALRKACERINRRELRRNNRKLRFVVETSPTKRDRFD